MKKRIFGMLLMGAMVIASMSMFTSCKDYDDDINANKAEIASLKTALQEQKTSLEAAIAAAKSEAQTANATLNTKLTELQTLVGNNKTDLENAIKAAVTDSKAYADGIGADALKVAKEYADAAAKEAAATAKAEALEAASKDLADLKALMEAGDDAAAKKASELAAKIDAVDESVNKLIAAEKEERVNALLAVNTQIENIKLQIAALEKFQATITQQVADIAKDLESTKKILEGVKATAEKNAEDIKANKEAIAKNVSAIADLSNALGIVDDKVAGLEDQVALLKKADAELGTKIDNLEKKLTDFITNSATAISDIDAAYKAADAALKSEFQDLLKGYYTKTEVDNLIKNFITSEALAPYAKTADVTAAIEAELAKQKTAMEEQITATLNAYDAKLADALAALFGTNAEGAAAADVTMSEEAIKALEALKANFNNGINKQVEEQLNVLKIAQTGQLRSLVFQPELYYDGIESVEVLALKDTLLALVDETQKGLVTELWGVKGKSFVAVPDSALTTYYIKVPASNTNGPAYKFNAWFDKDGKKYGTATGGYDFEAGKNDVQYKDIYPYANAKYHINPSSADLKDVTLSFYTNVAKVNWNTPSTRQGNDGLATPKYTDKLTEAQANELVEDGILTVPFSVNRAELNKIRYAKDSYKLNVNSCATTGYSQEAFIALQANYITEEGADTTITSDYALLVPNDIEIVALAGTWLNTDEDEKHYIGTDHLWTKLIANKDYTTGNPAVGTVGSADYKAAGQTMPISSGFMLYEEGTMKVNGEDVTYYSPIDAFEEGAKYCLDVVYNESVDLKTKVKTHVRRGYRKDEKTFIGAYDDVLDAEELENLGLEYKFEAIHYVSGSNRTDEYEHIEVIDGVAYPRSVTEDGKMIAGETATSEIAGRLPIVRATLEDADGNVYAVGYIMIRITDPAPKTDYVEITLPDGYMNCTAPVSVTWSQVEALILREVGMNKTAFETQYTLETIGHDAALDGRFFSIQAYPEAEDHYGDKIAYKAVDPTPAGYVNKTAVQYVKDNKNNKWVKVTAANAVAANSTKDTPRPLGAVYETLNGERQQTTVLEWNIGSQLKMPTSATNNTAANQTRQESTEKAMAAAKVDPETGLSTEAIEVVVAYKKKNKDGEFIDDNAIYVKLIVPAGKLHFAYGEVSGKDLGHWYQNNSWLNSTAANESDAIEIHLNTPTPALTNAQATGITQTWSWEANTKSQVANLQDIDFNKILQQTFMNDLVGISGIDLTHFSKFENTNFTFHLVAPETAKSISTNINATTASQNTWKNGNTSITDAEAKALSWTVKGVTGNEYLVYVSKNEPDNSGNYTERIQIAAYKDAADGNKVHFISDADEKTVVILKYSVDYKRYAPNGTGGYSYQDAAGTQIALMSNRYAQDILNYVGRFDEAGTDLNTNAKGTSYLSSEDKTFTAFIGIENTNECYKMYMPNSYFKVRWLRPINIYNVGKAWFDATNAIQEVDVAALVAAKDWRGIAVNGALTTVTGNTNAQFYGINDSTFHHFYVDTTKIYTDHYLPVGSRTAYKSNQVAEIEALKLRESISSLSPNFLWTAEKDSKLKLFYKNNATNVGIFHIYVPVYVAYSFGEFDYNGMYEGGNAVTVTQKSDANNAPRFNFKEVANAINNGARTSVGDNTVNKATKASDIKAPLYTQKVYAVITIGQTHGSQTQPEPAGARNK